MNKADFIRECTRWLWHWLRWRRSARLRLGRITLTTEIVHPKATRFGVWHDSWDDLAYCTIHVCFQAFTIYLVKRG